MLRSQSAASINIVSSVTRECGRRQSSMQVPAQTVLPTKSSHMSTVCLYRVSGPEIYKNTSICFCFSTQKLYAIYVFNSVQSNAKRFLCTSVHFNLGRDVTTFLDETFPGRWVGRGGHTAWPPRSPDLTTLDFFAWGLLRTLCIGKKFEIWLIRDNVSLKQLSL